MVAKEKVKSKVADITVDKSEIDKFNVLAKEWWDPNGKFHAVHKFNRARCDYISTYIINSFSRSEDNAFPLKGISILDIGCGGGLVSEPLSVLGANVVGIDAAKINIEIAKQHCAISGLNIDYRHGTAKSTLNSGEIFDIVLNLEVIEHVLEPRQLIMDCAKLLRPEGLLAVATLNRTLQAFIIAILGAEYVLRWLPRGTHDWRRFLKPKELAQMITMNNLEICKTVGLSFNPFARQWRITNDESVNYLMIAKRKASLQSEKAK